MKTIVFFLCCFLLVNCQTDLNSSEPVTQSENMNLGKMAVATEYDLLMNKYMNALEKKDVDLFMSCWLDDPNTTLILADGTALRGWDNIFIYVERVMGHHEVLNLQIDDLYHSNAGSDVVTVGSAIWQRELNPECGSESTTLCGVWSDVSCFVNGKLQIVVGHDLFPCDQYVYLSDQ